MSQFHTSWHLISGKDLRSWMHRKWRWFSNGGIVIQLKDHDCNTLKGYDFSISSHIFSFNFLCFYKNECLEDFLVANEHRKTMFYNCAMSNTLHMAVGILMKPIMTKLEGLKTNNWL